MIFFSLTILTIILGSCNIENASESGSVKDSGVIGTVSEPSSCPYMTQDTQGNIVLSYVKDLNDSVSVVCYIVSTDKGKSFGEAVEIPASKGVHPHGENMPKIIFKPDGEIISIWGTSNPNAKNKYSGHVFYSQSFDSGKTWTDATQLVSDTASFDQRYFDVALLKNNEAGVIWLDNRKKTDKEGSTIYFASTSGKEGFTSETAFGETVCQCCRTDLFVDHSGVIHATFRDIINDSIRDMVHCSSTDNGKTFNALTRISDDNWKINGCPHTGPSMTESNGSFHFAWYTLGSGEGVFYCKSEDGGRSFSERASVSNNDNAKHPQIRTKRNGDVVIVWDESPKDADKNSKQIGYQVRTANGEVKESGFATPANEFASFPYLMVVDDEVLLAYTRKTGKTEHVFFQSLEFKPQKEKYTE